MLLSIYSVLSTPLSILGSIYYYFKKGDTQVLERWGFSEPTAHNALWFHAASMGEVNGLITLIRRIKESYPAQRLFITTSTRTALERVRNSNIECRIVPLDNPFSINKFLKSNKPAALIITETEIWPNMIRLCQRHNIPVGIINGRISERTSRSLKSIGREFSQLMQKLTFVCSVDLESSARYQNLGVSKDKIAICGNSKYDLKPSLDDPAVRTELKAALIGETYKVCIFGSVHPDECSTIMPAIKQLLDLYTDLKIILVPRHIDKLQMFVDKLTDSAINYIKYSDLIRTEEDNKRSVILVDTMGVLESLYAISDVAVIGGTFNDLGGHNPLEAANYGVALVFGPSRSMIIDVSNQLLSSGGANSASNATELKDRLLNIFSDKELLQRMKDSSLAVALSNRGASEKILMTLVKSGLIKSSQGSV